MRRTGGPHLPPPPSDDDPLTESYETVDMSSEAQAARALDKATGDLAQFNWVPVAVLVVIVLVIVSIIVAFGVWAVVTILKAAF